MSPTSSAHPIQTLREHATALEAAITLALADPKKDPVHRLRTSTRRIEAQLELLSLIPDLPEHKQAAHKVRKLLKKLRQVAGNVRDLDVQRSLIKDQANNDPSRHLRRDARHLRRTLKDDRSTEAGKLLKLLALDQKKLAPALEKLLGDLEPAVGLTLPSSHLTQLTRQWYRQNTSQIDPGADPDNLHAVRKSAKLARYIAEASDATLAQRFESLQAAGGTWHDLLTLTDIAKVHLGGKSPLTQRFEQQHAEALDRYREALRQQAPEP